MINVISKYLGRKGATTTIPLSIGINLKFPKGENVPPPPLPPLNETLATCRVDLTPPSRCDNNAGSILL